MSWSRDIPVPKGAVPIPGRDGEYIGKIQLVMRRVRCEVYVRNADDLVFSVVH